MNIFSADEGLSRNAIKVIVQVFECSSAWVFSVKETVSDKG